MISAFGVVHKAWADDHPIRAGAETVGGVMAAGAAGGAIENSIWNRLNRGSWKDTGSAARQGAKMALKSKQNLAIAGIGGAGVTGLGYLGRKKSEKRKATAAISKGRYSDTMEVVQEHRRKANRRRSTGEALLGIGTVAGTTAAANTEGAKSVGRWAGNKIGMAGEAVSTRHGAKAKWYGTEGRDYYRWSTLDSKTTRANKGGLRLMRLGARVATKPGAAVAGVIGGTLAAGAGVTAAGMAHNARANHLAREYNRKKLNSKIKVAPITAKNRF